MRSSSPHLLTLILLLSGLLNLGLSAARAEEPTSPDEQFQAIMALPYLQGYVQAPAKTGVVKYNRQLASPGLTLYSSGHAPSAFLMDMKGKVLHSWSFDIHQAWPDIQKGEYTPFWESVYLYPNGDLLAIYQHGGVIKLDKDSRLLWAYRAKTHHAITVDANGYIYTLVEERLKLKDGVWVLDHPILILSPEGKFVQKISLLGLIVNSQNPAVESIAKRVVGIALAGGEDVFHANTLKVLDGSLSQQSPVIFKQGNILTSMLTLSTIAIIDPELPDIVWVVGPSVWKEGQHDPGLLPDGNMLIFDNHYQGRKDQSRVLEFKPFTREVVWEYKDAGFYTDTHGANQRLPNGNTLIAESNTGRAFEVTPAGRVVWEFLNPHTTGEKNDLIAAVFHLQRLAPKAVQDWLTIK